ncbi:hypothetical protein ACVU7I_02150 [Patulibacter sp. S7RM1-6]
MHPQIRRASVNQPFSVLDVRRCFGAREGEVERRVRPLALQCDELERVLSYLLELPALQSALPGESLDENAFVLEAALISTRVAGESWVFVASSGTPSFEATSSRITTSALRWSYESATCGIRRGLRSAGASQGRP